MRHALPAAVLAASPRCCGSLRPPPRSLRRPGCSTEDGATAPQFDFTKAIEEIVWVESEIDSDRDGARDLIRVRISRPREAARKGYKVPVVYEHSPYRGNTGNPANHDVDFDALPQERGATRERAARAARARRAHRSPGPRPARRPARHARRLLRAARLRGRARRERRHVQLAGLPGRRRRRRDARHQGRDRLAQRPRARLRRRGQPGRAPTGRPATSAWSARPTTARCPTRWRRPASRGSRRSSPSRRSPPGTTTTAPTASSWRRTPTPTAPARTATSARTPTCSATTSAARGWRTRTASAASCTTTCSTSRTA